MNGFEADAGKGVKCTVNNTAVHLGNRRCLAANDINISPGTFDAMEYLENKGQASVFFLLLNSIQSITSAFGLNILHCSPPRQLWLYR